MNFWKALKIGWALIAAIHKITSLVESGKVDSALIEDAIAPVIAAAGLVIDGPLLERIIGFAVWTWANRTQI